MQDKAERLGPEHENSQGFIKPAWVFLMGKEKREKLMEQRDASTS